MSNQFQQCIRGVWTDIHCTCDLTNTLQTSTTTQPSTNIICPTITLTDTPNTAVQQMAVAIQATPTPYPDPFKELFYTCLPLQSLYFSMMAFLSLLALILAIGWLHTCIVLKHRIKKLRPPNNLKDLTANFVLASTSEAVGTLVRAHPYERMKTTNVDSDYNLLKRDEITPNGHKTPKLSITDLPPDYEYNKLEKPSENHEEEIAVAIATDDNPEQRMSCDYDHLDDDALPTERPPQRDDYYTLKGPINRTNRPYHIVDSPGVVVRERSRSRCSDYSVLVGPGMASHRTHTTSEPAIGSQGNDDMGSQANEIRIGQRNDYHVLEGPFPTKPPAQKRRSSDYHVLEGPFPAKPPPPITRRCDYYVLEGPGMASYKHSASENNIFEHSTRTVEKNQWRMNRNSNKEAISIETSAQVQRALVTDQENSIGNATEVTSPQRKHQYSTLEGPLLPPKPTTIDRSGKRALETDQENSIGNATEVTSPQRKHQYHTLEGPLLPPKPTTIDRSGTDTSLEVPRISDSGTESETPEPEVPNQEESHTNGTGPQATMVDSNTADIKMLKHITTDDCEHTQSTGSINSDYHDLRDATHLDTSSEMSLTTSEMSLTASEVSLTATTQQSDATSMDSDYQALEDASHLSNGLKEQV